MTTCVLAQTYEEVVAILKSLPSVKGVRLSVNASFFGVSWAAAQDQATFTGVLAGWRNNSKKVLMVKWEGWDRNRQCALEALEKDSDGESLNVTLLPYEDGRAPPALAEGGDSTDEDEDVGGEQDEPEEQEEVQMTVKTAMMPLGIDSLTWQKKKPDGISEDARGGQSRFKPSMNASFPLKDIVALFFYLYPDEWISLQLKYPQLLGRSGTWGRTAYARRSHTT
mmetsp:Transcript_29166/g.72727  ORF Transcript_29166/g.72727 Transcript_29166/m.72727 type:complete len:224 (-) Transcript_29166:1230-1901(-)